MVIPVFRAVLGRWPFSSGDPREEAGSVVTRESADAERAVTAPPVGHDAVSAVLGSALPRDRSLLWSVIDNSTAVIYVKDASGRFLLVNRRFEELFHDTQESVAGKTDYDLFPVEQADAFQVFDRRVIAAGTVLEAEEAAHMRDATYPSTSPRLRLRSAAPRPAALAMRTARRALCRALLLRGWESSASPAQEVRQVLALELAEQDKRQRRQPRVSRQFLTPHRSQTT